MQKTFSVLALIVCGSWGASVAKATTSYCDGISGNMVTNCGFETGDFTGWTIGGLTDNPGGNYYGVDAFDLNTGSVGAYMSQDFVDDGTGFVNLSQTLTTISGTNYTVSFFLEQDTAPTLGYIHTFSATWGATTLLSLTPTVALPGTVGSFTQYSYTIAATGASTALKFAFENDDNYWSFDDVSVTAVTATPEPSTLMLAGLALGGLLVARRRIAG
jgi:PEP-CTERM motif